jgi:hypothetical protein
MPSSAEHDCDHVTSALLCGETYMPFCFHAQKSFGSGCEVCTAWMAFRHLWLFLSWFRRDFSVWLYALLCYCFVTSLALDCLWNYSIFINSFMFLCCSLMLQYETTVIVLMHQNSMYCFRIVFWYVHSSASELWFAPLSVFYLQQWFKSHASQDWFAWVTNLCVNYIVLSFGWSSQEDWDGQDMWHVWGRGELHTGL